MQTKQRDGLGDSLDEDLTGALVSGRYLLDGRIGGGGMGTVYRATHRGLGKEVALKVLRAELCTSGRSVERFVREARSVGAIGHPNVVDVYDVGHLPDGRPYLVMELLRGTDLSRLLHAHGPCPVERVVELLRGPAEGLDAIHARGMLHRDIKPGNLVLIERGGAELVKIVDFGLAAFLSAAEPRLTTLGTVCGTPQYMAPESTAHRLPDPRADVYSLATVAFELLAGRPPFVGRMPAHVLANKLHRDAPKLGDLAPVPVSAAVEELLARALSRSPADRPPSASALIAELARAHAAGGDREPSRLRATLVNGRRRSPPEHPGEPVPHVAVDSPVRLDSLAPPVHPSVRVATDPRSERSRNALLAAGLAAISLGVAAALLAVGVVASTRGRSEDRLAGKRAPIARAAVQPVEPPPAAAAAVADVQPSTAEPFRGSPSDATRPRAVDDRRTRRRERAVAEPAMRTAVAPSSEPPVDRGSLAREWTREADALALGGQLPAAADLYRRTTTIAPRYAPAWRGLGIVSERLGRPADARRAFARYLELAPGAHDADRIRARLDGL
jgi:serine/threonine protein kinase